MSTQSVQDILRRQEEGTRLARLNFCPLAVHADYTIDAIMVAYRFTTSEWRTIHYLHLVYMRDAGMGKLNKVRCECGNR